MPRPPLPLGTWGRIQRRPTSGNRWLARALFRDLDGISRHVEAHGATGTAAERNLMTKLVDRTHGFGEEINSRTTIRALGTFWIDQIASEGRLGEATVQQYTRTFETIIEPGMGNVRLAEIRVSVVDAFLKSLRKTGVASREDRARKALSLMFQVAVLHDALSTNPVAGLSQRSRGAKEIKALDVGNVAEVRQFVRMWELEKVGRSGPKRSYTLSEMVDVMLGSGIRIGELLALRWMDVDLESPIATITVAGTLTQPAKGPLVRKSSPKSKAGFRVLTLPDYARDVFVARLAEAGEVDPEQGVFLTRNGTWVTPNNVRRDLRAARAESGFEWVTPHTFRKSVATLIDGEEGSKSAASQLGHSSDTVTKTHYIQKAASAGDHRETLDKFAPADEMGSVNETGDVV